MTVMFDQKISDGEWLRRLWSGPETVKTPAKPAPTEDIEARNDGVAAEKEKAGPRRKMGLTGWLASAAAVMTVFAIALNGVLTSHTHPQPTAHHTTQPVPVAATSPAPTTPVADTDPPLPFISHADCPPGPSNDGRGLANPQNPVPWICVHRTDGQSLHMTLTGVGAVEHSYVITGFVIIPGDAGPADVNGHDPWLAHRCVKLLSLQFNDIERTPPVSLDTQCKRGEAFVRVPNVKASRVTLIEQLTRRPQAQPPAKQATSGVGGFLEDFIFPQPQLPTAGQPDTGTDPSDGTFAVGEVKILGHEAT
jgi:hypothetical protein